MARSRDVTVTVTPAKRPSSLTIDVSPTEGVAPLTIRVSGSLNAADSPYEPIPYASIDVYMNGTLIGTPSTMDDGTWYLDYTISVEGTYTIFAEFLGNEWFEGCGKEDHTVVGVPAVFPWVILGALGTGIVMEIASIKT